jgi:hypothetical protein
LLLAQLTNGSQDATEVALQSLLVDEHVAMGWLDFNTHSFASSCPCSKRSSCCRPATRSS